MKKGIICTILTTISINLYAQVRDVLPVKIRSSIADKVSLYTQYVHRDTMAVFSIKIVIRPPGGLDRVVFSTGVPHRADSLLQIEFDKMDVDWSQLYDSTDLTGIINIILPVLKTFDLPSDKSTLNMNYDAIANMYLNSFTFPLDERKWSKSSTILCSPLIIRQRGPSHM